MLTERFWSKVITSDTHSYNGTPCLEWTATTDSKGYGKFGLNGKTKQAHRVSYEDAKRKIPEGLELDHLCRNTSCVNSDHLEPVTNKENCRRGLVGFVTGLKNRLKTHCPQGHEYSKENTYNRSDKVGRICRTCIRIKSRQWNQRKKLELSEK